MTTALVPMIGTADLLAGDVPDDLIRLPGVCRLLGVPLGRRAELIAWLATHCPPVEPDHGGPLVDRPASGAYSLRAVAAAVRHASKKGRVPSFMENVRGASGP